MPPEWFGLNFISALLTKVYWNYATPIVRVCVSPLGPIYPHLHLSKNCSIQVKFGSKAMASLYDLLCYHSFTSTDPLLEELLSYLPTRFHSHIFDYIVYEQPSDDESVQSFDSSVSAFYYDDSTFFPEYFYIFLVFYAAPRFLQQRWEPHDTKGHWPRTTSDRKEDPGALQYYKTAVRGKQVHLPLAF